MPLSPLSCGHQLARRSAAKELNVDIKSLDLVELTDTPCRSDRNYNQCILCCQQWFPRKLNKGGKVKKQSPRLWSLRPSIHATIQWHEAKKSVRMRYLSFGSSTSIRTLSIIRLLRSNAACLASSVVGRAWCMFSERNVR